MIHYFRAALLMGIGLQICASRFTFEDESYSEDFGDGDSEETYYDLDEDYWIPIYCSSFNSNPYCSSYNIINHFIEGIFSTPPKSHLPHTPSPMNTHCLTKSSLHAQLSHSSQSPLMPLEFWYWLLIPHFILISLPSILPSLSIIHSGADPSSEEILQICLTPGFPHELLALLSRHLLVDEKGFQ